MVKDGACQYRSIFERFMTLGGKSRSYQGLLESKKKIGGNHAFFRGNSAKIAHQSVKNKAMYGIFFHIEALLSLKNAWLSPIFFLDAKGTC